MAAELLTWRRARGLAVAAAVATATVTAAVAVGAAAGRDASPAPRTVTIDVRHSRFSVERVEVPRGSTVRFVLHNTDPIPHELIVGDQATQDRHEQGTEAHHGDRPGEVSAPPGATVETTMTFDRPGAVPFGCHLPGHWAYGMQGVVAVR